MSTATALDSTFREGDFAQQVAELKQRPGPDLHVYGSANLVQTLLKHDLVDAIWLNRSRGLVGGCRPDSASVGGRWSGSLDRFVVDRRPTAPPYLMVLPFLIDVTLPVSLLMVSTGMAIS